MKEMLAKNQKSAIQLKTSKNGRKSLRVTIGVFTITAQTAKTNGATKKKTAPPSTWMTPQPNQSTLH